MESKFTIVIKQQVYKAVINKRFQVLIAFWNALRVIKLYSNLIKRLKVLQNILTFRHIYIDELKL